MGRRFSSRVGRARQERSFLAAGAGPWVQALDRSHGMDCGYQDGCLSR